MAFLIIIVYFVAFIGISIGIVYMLSKMSDSAPIDLETRDERLRRQRICYIKHARATIIQRDIEKMKKHKELTAMREYKKEHPEAFR